MASPPWDPQQLLVYFWENQNFRALFYGAKMSKAEAEKMARSMARMYGVPAPRLTTKRWGLRGDTARQDGPVLTVNIDKAGWTPILLAHEMAHWIKDSYNLGGADHGPVWMSIYMLLLHHYRILPQHVTEHSARVFTIKFKELASCVPGKLKRKKK